MVAGGIIAAITSIVMWYPPIGQGAMAVNIFVIAMLALLFTVGYSFFTIPYTAMGYEMSTDSDGGRICSDTGSSSSPSPG